jgi:predicted O-methyltransferase YrrM
LEALKMNKKVIKDIIYGTVKDLKSGSFDLAFTIKGQDLINMDLDEGLKIMKDNGLVKDDNLIIPAGVELTNTQQYGGAIEYNFGNGFIVVDLAFDNDENEYIA